MRSFFTCFCIVFLSFASAIAAPHFPALTGRVVDAANLLYPSDWQRLKQLLADHEQNASNQVVVVTIPSLEGLDIETYGVQLGRHWQIGKKGENNGVLLIIAPYDHQARIEVGYGLEGQLTDALVNQIIQRILIPNLKGGHIDEGIIHATQAILDILNGKTPNWSAAENIQEATAIPNGDTPNSSSSEPSTPQSENWKAEDWYEVAFLLLLACGFIWLFGFFIKLCLHRPDIALAFLVNAAIDYSSSDSRSGDSDFSGGGGSFGGGGASGKW